MSVISVTYSMGRRGVRRKGERGRERCEEGKGRECM